MVFYVIIFLIPFIAIPVFAIYMYIQKKHLQSKYPNKPWKHKKDWIDGKIDPNTGMMKAGLCFFGSVYIAIVFGYPIGRGYIEGQLPSLVLLFAIIAFVGLFVVLLLIQAIKAMLIVSKYGKIYFQLADETGTIGGRLAGIIYIPVQVDTGSGFNISLRCVEITQTQSGKKSHKSENILWEDSKTIKKDALSKDNAATGIPILFHIPNDGIPCQDWKQINNRKRKCVLWRLHVSADMPGLDFQNAFDVPVFHTEDRLQEAQIDETKYNEFTYKPSLQEALLGTRIQILSDTQNQLHIQFQPKYSPFMQCVLAPAAIGIYIIAQWKTIEIIFAVVYSIIPITIVSLFLILILVLFLVINMYQSQIEVNQEGVTLKSKLLFLHWQKQFSYHQIKQVSIRVKKQSGKKVQPYELLLETTKTQITVTDIIPGKHLAEMLEEKINQAITNLKS